jgi:hypothetical protein
VGLSRWADLGGRKGLANDTRSHTVPNPYTRLSPAYRQLDTIGNLGLDGVGDKLRAVILIDETVQVVASDSDCTAEWRPGCDTIAPTAAVSDPSSRATFAHHIPTNRDRSFGDRPWE